MTQENEQQSKTYSDSVSGMLIEFTWNTEPSCNKNTILSH